MAAHDLKKILYVEDDSYIQRVAQIALQKVGDFDVKICSSGQQALAEASAFAPDLILLDVMLPEMDGLSIQAALKQNEATANIPVVFMTARVQPDEVEEYRRRGALDVIFKPFDPMTLAGTLRELWDNRYG